MNLINRLSIYTILVFILLIATGCEHNGFRPSANMPLTAENLSLSNVTPADLMFEKRVYVPVYSSIYWRSSSTVELVATMSVRNIDSDNPVFVTHVDYYNSEGKIIRTYIDKVHELGPMATTSFVVPLSDKLGGTGANFVVEWGARNSVPDPIIETVMFGQAGNAGISFVSRGTVINTRPHE